MKIGIPILLHGGRWYYGWFLPWTPGGTMNDYIHGRHGGRVWRETNMAAGTMADFCHGHQGAL
jgi:hypothetical protein